MADKDRNPRRLRREVLDRFEQGFDFERLDYDRRFRPVRGKAFLFGVALAGLLYMAGFGLGYYAWQHAAVSYELFAKLAWILMLPATLIGAFAWLLNSQRSEYRLRQDIRAYISGREAEGGFLWRFAPLFEALRADDYTAKRLLQESAESPESMDPEDYARSVTALRRQLEGDEQNPFSTDVASRVFANLSR
jgi:hypothetical protein